jgi:DNA adenine methylase
MIGYIGGKHRLAKQLIPLFPPHVTYVEPFAGMAHVFFRKPESQSEVLNDLNEDIVTFLRVCQHHHPELCRYLRYAASSRKLFELYQKQEPATLTDVQRAARFFYLQRAAFGGKVIGRTYTPRVGSGSPFEQSRLVQRLDRMARRLERVHLECLPYEILMRRLDRESTFFFCDPPYVGTRTYVSNFLQEDYERLALELAGLRGRFLMTINDHPLARTVFGSFNCRDLFVRYSVNHGSGEPVRQLVFTNYDISAGQSVTGELAAVDKRA